MRLAVSAGDLAFFLAFGAAVTAAAWLRNRIGLAAAVAAALGCAGYTLFVDAHADEVTATAMVIVGGTFLLGVAVPANAWRWAAIIGLAIPAKSLVDAIATGSVFDARIFITVGFALAGAYAGAGIRRAASAT